MLLQNTNTYLQAALAVQCSVAQGKPFAKRCLQKQ